jgi:hypothetical protein
MSTSTYPIYNTLPDASDNLRLLIVHAGGVSEPIRCTLRTVSFRDKPSYEALSYTWGDTATTELIEVDGFDIQVTANLEQALRHLRDVEIDLTLWVDAVCINQSDSAEKSHQVAFMGKIYRDCAQVRIWLGCDSSKCCITQSSFQPSDSADGNSGTVDPFELIRNLANDQHIYEWPCFRTENDCGRDTTVYEVNDKWTEIREAFLAVMESPWWSRMWTVQEAVLPRKGILTYDVWCTSLQTITDCGFKAYEHIVNCCRDTVLQFPPKFYASLENFFFVLLSLANGRIRYDNGDVQRLELQRQHVQYSYRECQDPRDNVYGLLGIAGDITFKPDYTWSIHEVFLRATCHMLCHEKGTLGSLTGHQYGPAPGKWASWARQFDAPVDSTFSGYALKRYFAYHPVHSNIFDASDGHKSKRVLLMAHPTLGESDASHLGLEIVGRRVGRLNFVSQETFLSPIIRDVSRVLRQWTLDALNWDVMDSSADNHAYNNSPNDSSKYPETSVRFWRTLLGGLDIPHNVHVSPSEWTRFTPATMEWLDEFFSWFRVYQPMDQAIFQMISVAAYGRRYFKAGDSSQGLCYPNACVGDEVWVLHGGDLPFILRPVCLDQEERGTLIPLDEQAFMKDGNFVFKDDCQPAKAPDGYYELVGDCYFDEFMHGEAMHDAAFQDQTIVLV